MDTACPSMLAERKVELTLALEDSPLTQAMVASMEESIAPVKQFVTQLKEASQALYAHQIKVVESINEFGTILSSVDKMTYDEDSFTVVAIKQLGKHMFKLQSWQEMLCAQYQVLVQQLNSFLNEDIATLLRLKESHVVARKEHNQKVLKFSKVSKKKETEKSHYDANAELSVARRQFHRRSLNYYSELNSFQYKKKFSILDPLLVFMQAQVNYFKMGHDIMTEEAVGESLASIDVKVQNVRSEHEQAMKTQRQTKCQLESQSPQLCIPDPNPSDPRVHYQAPDLQLTSKSGHLYHRPPNVKSWERLYFYTNGQLLYSQQQSKPPTVFCDLIAENVTASTTDIDDRRYVFEIIGIQHRKLQQQQHHQPHIQRKPLLHLLQAESAKSRDEWIAAIVNIASRKILPQPSMADLINIDFESMTRDVSLVSLASHSRQPPPQQTKQIQPVTIPKMIKAKPLYQITDSEGVGRVKNGVCEEVVYSVWFWGFMEVKDSRGINLLQGAIQTVMATAHAQALKNALTAVFYVNIVISHDYVSMIDSRSGRTYVKFKTKDISYYARHPDNNNGLFGIVMRHWTDGKEKFLCYVFEGSNAICQSVIDAIKDTDACLPERLSASEDTSRAPSTVSFCTDRKLEADHWHREDSFDFLSKQVKPTQSQESVDDLFITDSSIATELTLDASTEQLSNRHDKIESNGHRDTIESNCLSSFETTVF